MHPKAFEVNEAPDISPVKTIVLRNNDDLPVEPEEQQHKGDGDKARANAAVLFVHDTEKSSDLISGSD